MTTTRATTRRARQSWHVTAPTISRRTIARLRLCVRDRNDDVTKGHDNFQYRSCVRRAIARRRQAARGRRAAGNRSSGGVPRGARRAATVLGEGCASLFTYCTQVLHLSEHAAYGRIEAARAARRFPVILNLLAAGAVTLTAVSLLAPHLTTDNHRDVLETARHKSKREVEHLVAALRPRPAIPASVRKLPSPKPADLSRTGPEVGDGALTGPARHEGLDAAASVPRRSSIVAPTAPAQYKVQFTVSGETYEKLRRAQDLLRHTIPNGDPAAIFDRALTLLVAELEKTKLAAATRPRVPRPSASGSRHVPAAIKRVVWKRDGGQCAFVGGAGRCTERGFLEYHHVVPYADGGATTTDNLQLRCRAHNAYEAAQHFGSLWVRERAAPDWWMIGTRSGPGWRVVEKPVAAQDGAGG